MNVIRITVLVVLLVVGTRRGNSQGSFQNLNFEAANVAPLPAGSFELVAPADAFPGWQAYFGDQLASRVLHNSPSIGSVSLSILGPNLGGCCLEGNFTAVLQAGAGAQFEPVNAALAQTALVPASAVSLLFKARSESDLNLAVRLGGQNLSLTSLQITTNYTLYGANVGSFAGQVAELRFTGLHTPDRPFNPVFLDSIQFSTTPVPEPSTWALFGLGSALLLCGTRRKRS